MPQATVGHDPYYAYDKYRDAVRVLATSPGEVRSRLRAAVISYYQVLPGHVPRHLRRDVRWIRNQVARLPPQTWEKSRITSTLRRIRVSTALPIAERIFQVYDDLGEWITTHPLE